MKFIDEIKIGLKAGDGGRGTVAWRREKFIPKGGPAGGDGGKGGDIFVKGIRDLNKLYDYRNIKNLKAENGEEGGGNSKHGKDGKDLILSLPIGSIIRNLDTEEEFELEKENEIIKILEGGNGGYGNEYFKSSKNVSPKEWTPGKKGEEGNFSIELKLIADVGFVGLPNAGKSSLLNELTNAKAKVASYKFTTLDPNLGDLYGVILADIPGLIEGASEGKGMGYKFLKHIERTKILVHCISVENEDMEGSYNTIREELGKYNEKLLNKGEIICITKTDLIDEIALKEIRKEFQKKHEKVFDISIYDSASAKELSDFLTSSILSNDNE